MISYTGTHITREFGAVNITDMAVQGCRLVRFAGAGHKVPFWPVALHSLLVADILCYVLNRPDLEHEGLLHDLEAEAIMNDIPKPHKTDEQKTHEKALARRTRTLLGLLDIFPADERVVKLADIKAVHAEGAAGCGPRGYVCTQTGFKHDVAVDRILDGYLENPNFTYENMLNPDGFWPLHFEDRLREALQRAQKIESIRA